MDDWPARGAKVLADLQRDFSLTREQAGGIVGNIGFESTGFTQLHEIGQPEGRGGYGWAQWTADRRKTFFAYCDERHLDWRLDAANYGYLCFELRSSQIHALEQLRKTKDLDSAIFTFGYYFERPGGTTENHLPGQAQRLDYAKRALAGTAVEAPKPVTPSTEFQRGDAGEFVTLIQQALGISADGQFGPATANAVVAFQQKHRMKPTGEVDKRTWNRLFRWPLKSK